MVATLQNGKVDSNPFRPCPGRYVEYIISNNEHVIYVRTDLLGRVTDASAPILRTAGFVGKPLMLVRQWLWKISSEPKGVSIDRITLRK